MTSKWVPTTDLMMLRRMGKLAEELGELGAVAARCIIQGIDEDDPASGKMNRLRLTEEIADVYAQLDVTVEALDLARNFIADRRERKTGYMREWEAMFAAESQSREPAVSITVFTPSGAEVASWQRDAQGRLVEGSPDRSALLTDLRDLHGMALDAAQQVQGREGGPDHVSSTALKGTP